MDDVYEVDNRYPEVAEPYERIRGGRHHDRLNGARACRTARVNSLKRSFWTSAAAVVAAVTLLLASPGEKPNAVEPEAFLEPELSIVAAARPEADRLEYQYRIELNDAEQAEVTVAARTAEGELLASAGPFLHTRTENAEPLAFLIPGGEDYSKIVLELTCTYTREGETREKRAARELELANAPPETVTEQTEPEETETEATEPFVEPTLTITDAALTDRDLSPLTYGYQIELNSAREMEIRAEVTADSGEVLGSDGPYVHKASETAPAHGIDLSWTRRPAVLTLTLTGSYMEGGEERTVTASRELELPPFEAPALTIIDAEVNGSELTPLRYRYEVTLNSAKDLRVTAEIRSDAEEALGADGPYTHTESETSPDHSAALSWSTRPASLTLTLTGTYTEDGEEKTIAVTRTLEAPFTAPAMAITEASLNGSAVTPLSYRYRVTLNSAEDLRVSVIVRSNGGDDLGSDGPFTHTESETSPAHSAALRWSSRPSSVTLILVGTYKEAGKQKNIYASRILDVPIESFDPPNLNISSAKIDGIDSSVVVYSAGITLHASNPVTVNFTVVGSDGRSCGSAGPFTFTESGSLNGRTITCSSNASDDMTLVMTASYQMNGETKTVTARRRLENEPFVWPKIELDAYWYSGTKVTYTYSVSLNSAPKLRVRVQLFGGLGDLLEETPKAEVTSGSYSGTLDPGSSTYTLKVLGEFDHLGKTYTVEAVAYRPIYSVAGPKGGGRSADPNRSAAQTEETN